MRLQVDNINPGMVAVIGLTSVEIIKLWQSVAPSLAELRELEAYSARGNQRLMDADYLGAGLAVLIGGTTSILLKSWLPLIMALGSVVLFSQWHHMVLESTNESVV